MSHKAFYNKYRNLLLSCLVFMIYSSVLSAQFNIKTGYSISYHNPEVNNSILNTFNTSNADWLDNTFNEWRFMHGLQLGVRYKVEDMLGIEFTWANQFSKSIAKGVVPVTEEDYYRKLNYNVNQFSFGIEGFANEHFGIGASMDYDLLGINSRHEKKASKIKVVKDAAWSSTFFITYHTIPNNGISLAIRPFVKVPWTELDYSGLSEDLEIAAPTNGIKGKNMQFGLSILFFNGN